MSEKKEFRVISYTVWIKTVNEIVREREWERHPYRNHHYDESEWLLS